jgi:RNA polymerase sigma-70 factor, ECF subfamily
LHQASWTAAEQAARESYGRLVSWLAYQWRDVAAAEDALADAFATALRVWPETGVPASPDAWLLTAAKRNLLQNARHQRVVNDPASTILLPDDITEDSSPPIPDERLKLMFVCAHPAIDEKTRTPLMLQTVLGLDAQRIASAFLVSPSTMAQRLVRAKNKIRDAGIRFERPEQADAAPRMEAVLDAIYAAFGTSWDAIDAADDVDTATDLAEEAIYLARLMAQLLPDQPETMGLLALMLFSHARRAARFTASGTFVPLAEQDTSQWDRPLMIEADTLLFAASQKRQPGPFQLEAAIQSAHCQRAINGETPWRGIAALYHGLIQIAPTLGARVGEVVALVESGDVALAEAALSGIDAELVQDYQPYWVACAHLAQATKKHADAKSNLQRAIGLTQQPAVRQYLLNKLNAI